MNCEVLDRSQHLHLLQFEPVVTKKVRQPAMDNPAGIILKYGTADPKAATGSKVGSDATATIEP